MLAGAAPRPRGSRMNIRLSEYPPGSSQSLRGPEVSEGFGRPGRLGHDDTFTEEKSILCFTRENKTFNSPLDNKYSIPANEDPIGIVDINSLGAFQNH